MAGLALNFGVLLVESRIVVDSGVGLSLVGPDVGSRVVRTKGAAFEKEGFEDS